jgi:hypothetical protein
MKSGARAFSRHGAQVHAGAELRATDRVTTAGR